MDIIKLVTFWDADQAQTVVDFLDQLRDAVVEHYVDDIAQWHRENQRFAQQQIDFINDNPFDDPF